MPYPPLLQDSRVGATLPGKVRGNPLIQLVVDATRRRKSLAFERALLRHSLYFQQIVCHLAASGYTVAQKIETLPRASATPEGTFDKAVSSVLAFAVLLRFDDDFQEELARDGNERPYVNATSIDLMWAVDHNWHQHGPSGVVDLVANEAEEFLPDVESREELRAAAWRRLDDFRRLI